MCQYLSASGYVSSLAWQVGMLPSDRCLIAGSVYFIVATLIR